jgi:hypothetical protein
MDILVLMLIVGVACSACVIFIAMGYVGVIYSGAEEELPKWKCTNINDEKGEYVVSRIRNKESECINQKDMPGCFFIKRKYLDKEKSEIDYTDLKKQCSNIIQNFPNVKIAGKQIDMDVYTCGEGKDSTQYKLFKNSGYDDPEDPCAIIKKDRSAWQETLRILGLAPYAVPPWAGEE